MIQKRFFTWTLWICYSDKIGFKLHEKVNIKYKFVYSKKLIV
jgi:hypothetical protein